MLMQATRRAEVLKTIDHESPEMIDLVTPSTVAGSPYIESSIANTSTLDRP